MAKTPQIKLTKAGRTRGADYDPPAPRTKAERRPVGRPTAYDERVTIATACFLAKRGATDVEIADELGIETGTLYRWYGDHPEFREAVRAAKDTADDRMEQSLYTRGIGFKQPVEKVFANGNRLTVVEHVPGDVGAQMNWLKNRRRSSWRDTREVDLVVPDTGPQTEDLDTRALALAAINLLQDATDDPDVGRTTLDLEPNSTEEVDDDEDREEAVSARGDEALAEEPELDRHRQARPRGRRNQAEDFDPDFDL